MKKSGYTRLFYFIDVRTEHLSAVQDGLNKDFTQLKYFYERPERETGQEEDLIYCRDTDKYYLLLAFCEKD